MTVSIDRNQAAAKHFHDTARSWTDRYRTDCELSHQFLIRRQAVEWQLERIPSCHRERALDLGCGTGPYLRVLARLAKKVVGVDVAPGMIAEARRNLSSDLDNVHLITASVFDLPFPDDHFDVGVCVGVLEYFDDPAAVLRAAYRVIKPGGSMVFTVPSVLGISRITGVPRTLTLLVSPRSKVIVGAALNRLRGREADPSRYYLGASFTPARLRRVCEEADLTLSEMTTSGFDGLCVAGLPVPARLESVVDRWGEAHRHRLPWRDIGNNLIATIRKPSSASLPPLSPSRPLLRS